MTTIKKIIPLAAGIVWLVIVGIGLTKLYDYGLKAGPANFIAKQWPAETAMVRDEPRYQLMMFAHPQCVCTKASVGELELIMAKGQGKLNACVVFIKPPGFDESWVKSGLFNRVGNIPGVSVVIDDRAREARRFGATTSGQVLLYHRQGHLVFAGGITSARGHSGDNVGRSAIESMINNQPTNVTRTPVFGCILYD